MFSFCYYEKDENAIENIISKIDDENVKAKIEVVKYEGNIDEFLISFAQIELLIATRFHSMILGFKFGLNVIPICYTEKLKNVLVDIKFEGNYYDFSNVDTLDYINVITSHVDVDNLSKRANKHFKYLDRHLLN